MNHFRPRTAIASMAETLANVGRQLPPQEVRVLTTRCSGSVLGPSRLVFCAGDYFWLSADITYQQLLKGVTPDELELEAVDPDEEFA
jgi:hypothetical protein